MPRARNKGNHGSQCPLLPSEGQRLTRSLPELLQQVSGNYTALPTALTPAQRACGVRFDRQRKTSPPTRKIFSALQAVTSFNSLVDDHSSMKNPNLPTMARRLLSH